MPPLFHFLLLWMINTGLQVITFSMLNAKTLIFISILYNFLTIFLWAKVFKITFPLSSRQQLLWIFQTLPMLGIIALFYPDRLLPILYRDGIIAIVWGLFLNAWISIRLHEKCFLQSYGPCKQFKSGNRRLRLSIALSTLLLYLLFWQANWGINTLAYSAVLQLALYKLYPVYERNIKKVLFFAYTQIWTALMVTAFNAQFAKILFCVSTILFIAVMHHPEIKGFSRLWRVPIANLLQSPSNVRTLIKDYQPINQVFLRLRSIRYIAVPILISVIFASIYSIAHPPFRSFLTRFFLWTESALTILLKEITWEKGFYILFYLLLSTALLFRIRHTWIRQYTRPYDTYLKNEAANESTKMFSTQSEWITGVYTLILLNIMLATINLSDLSAAFNGFDYQYKNELRKMVYESTAWMIFSIILSITLLLILFRQEINFFGKSSLLRVLAYIWIGQNLLLLLTLFNRNYKYVQDYGLAYKRLGLFIFIFCTAGCLYFLVQKIRKLHTSQYFFQTNLYFIYVLMIGLSSFNWDNWIARYNFSRAHAIYLEHSFLNVLSDKALGVMVENIGAIRKQIDAAKVQAALYDTDTFDEELNAFTNPDMPDNIRYRTDRFLEAYPEGSWCSWNWADHKTFLYLQHHYNLLNTGK